MDEGIEAMGRPKPEALRLAQLSFIHPTTPATGYQLPAAGLSHPFHWAAFLLSGQ